MAETEDIVSGFSIFTLHHRESPQTYTDKSNMIYCW